MKGGLETVYAFSKENLIKLLAGGTRWEGYCPHFFFNQQKPHSTDGISHSTEHTPVY